MLRAKSWLTHHFWPCHFKPCSMSYVKYCKSGQEPSITTYQTHVNHSAWRLYRPTTETDAGRFRSLIYVNRKVSTSSHRQIACDHPDVTAIKIWTADSQFLIFSIYLSCVPLFTPSEASAEPALTAIQNTITANIQDGPKDYKRRPLG